jgi:pimeloyl-ACP methyl ester carboxylesterase
MASRGAPHAPSFDMQVLDRNEGSSPSPSMPRPGGQLPTTLPWRHHFARVEGVRLHWVEVGESSAKPPVVLLHGLNDCYRSWRGPALHLACDRRVLVPDLPGHGLSGRPDASYELQWYGRILTGWLGVVRAGRVDVVGHSFGGGVAQAMLLHRPKRIRRLVLVASGGLGREISVPLRLASFPLVVEYLGQRFMGPCTRLGLEWTGAELSERDAARLSAMNAQRGSARAFARTVRDVIDWRGQTQTLFQCAEELTPLPPIAVFWGERDPVIPFSHAEALAKAVDGVRITRFAKCGHYPHQENLGSFVRALRDFLDSPSVATTAWKKGPSRATRAVK